MEKRNSRGQTEEEILFAECDTGVIRNIRETINVFRDRRAELYFR